MQHVISEPRILSLLALLCLALGTGVRATEEPRIERCTVVARKLLGAPSRLEDLRRRGMDGILAIEDFQELRKPLSDKALARLLAELGHGEYGRRERASRRLLLCPPAMLPTLAKEARSTHDPEISERLREGIKDIRRIEKQTPRLAGLLEEMYNEHAEEVFEQRWPLLLKDPRHPRALQALSLIAFDRIWALLKEASSDEKTTYLLLKIYVGKEAPEAAQALGGVPAKDLLRVAGATWWPVEIEPLEKDGAYGWTTRAESVEGNTATHVIRMSVKMPDYGNVAERGEWVHLLVWSRVTYLFRFPGRYNKNVVAFAIPRSQCSVVQGRVTTSSGGSPRTATFRGVPAGVRLPLAHITAPESLDWGVGKRYEWAKPLFPPKLRTTLRFARNKHPVPRVDMPADLTENEKH